MANDFSGDANCVALWRFESGALTTDSKGTNTLTDVNTVGTDTTNYREGSASALFTSSSNEYFSITDASLNPGFPLKSGDTNKKISACLWFRGATNPNAQYLFCKGQNSANTRSFGAYIDSLDSYKLKIILGYSSGTAFELINSGYAIIRDGRWYHIGITFDDSDKSWKARIYSLTGDSVVANASGTSTNNIYVGGGPLGIGGQVGNTFSVNGNEDEVVFFNDILTSDEIDQIRAGTYGSTTILPIFINQLKQQGIA